jgi:hypothetical protein
VVVEVVVAEEVVELVEVVVAEEVVVRALPGRCGPRRRTSISGQ